mmetsp:Transcript_3897/g.5818  ORF Transcript_3897/g.5818 Transcript_3897/m.5818 type:complete len:439 (+) Transcript_3897:14-1330(+)
MHMLSTSSFYWTILFAAGPLMNHVVESFATPHSNGATTLPVSNNLRRHDEYSRKQPTTPPVTTTVLRNTLLEDMDQHELLDYLNSETAVGLSFQEYLKRQTQKSYLENCVVFHNIASTDFDRIAESMEEVKVPSGATLITKGDTKDDSMYFVVNGKFECLGENSTLLTTYQKPGEFFGELALIFKGQPRQATIIASDDSAVYKLDKNAFLDCMQDSPVFDTAKQMLLKKYSSTRLRDILPNIEIRELLDLVNAKLQLKARSVASADSMFAFSMGASFSLLASLWSGGLKDANNGCPIFFTAATTSSSGLPIQAVSTFLAITAAMSQFKIPPSQDQTPEKKASKQISVSRILHKLGFGLTSLMWALVRAKAKAGSTSVIAFLQLQMVISILMESTKKKIMTGGVSSQKKKTSKSLLFATIASCSLLSYEAFRVLYFGKR